MTTNERVKEVVKSMLCDDNGVILDFIADKALEVIEALDKPVVPQIGDRCIFWDDNINTYAVGELTGLSSYPFLFNYACKGAGLWKHAERLTTEAE